MSKHTPGPWITGNGWGLEIRPRFGRGDTIGFAPIAKVIGDNRLVDMDEREANARLIAAAPDLLEALECLLEMGHAKAGDLARAAIAKATGAGHE